MDIARLSRGPDRVGGRALRVLLALLMATLVAVPARPFLGNQVARGAQLSFSAAADSYVDSSTPSSNYGSRNEIRIDGSPTVTSYLRFAVNGASDFSSAVLRLHIRSTAGDGVQVRPVSDNSWAEGTITWNNAPAPGGVVVTSPPVPGGTWIDLNVSSLVTDNGAVSFAVTTTGSTAVAIRSRESSEVPTLLVGGGSSNQPPTATFSYSCADLSCSFDGTASSDPDGTIASYAWAFGSAGSGSGPSTSFTFPGEGSYPVTLTVTDNAGAADGDTQTVVVTTTPPPPPTAFTITRSGAVYQATSTSQTYSGTLKSVVESAVADLNGAGGGTIQFAAGDFDLGSEWFRFDNELVDITFAGQGMTQTTIRNFTSVSSDTEPFNFRGTNRVTIRDLTVHAGGPARTTSDAIDFDRGNNSLVERVRITASRGKGIIFDGKNVDSDGTPWHSTNNTVRDCDISGTSNDGIQFLASSNNRVENCTIADTGEDGIDVRKSQSDAQQPNKKSNGNVLIGNTIIRAGQNGIRVTSSDGTQITGNTITNSATISPNHDGIRIESTDSITCDDNVVSGNTATDTRVAKLQAHGLNITSALCNRTVVGSNNFTGNKTGDIRDQGTNTIYQHTDTTRPSAPTSLVANAPSALTVDLTWTAATDNIAVTGYEIFRDSSLLATVGAVTSFQDTSVAPSTAYAYQVRALDGAGNRSAFSNTANVTTPAPPAQACADSSGSGAYTVSVCFTAPANGSSLIGDRQVTATVSVTGSSPGIQKVLFWLGSEYLLTDYQAPYTFILETDRWGDGQKTLLVEAFMRDGFTSDRAAISTTFANGISQPPPNTNTFTPRQGTTPPSGKPFVFAAVGDGADGTQNAASVTDLIASWDPNMFSYLGDVYDHGTPTEYTNWYGIGTLYGRFRSITNPVIGNHENIAPNSAGYFDYWDNPPNYYSIDVAGWHVIFIDSTGAFGQTSPSSQQYQWIAADLAANPNPCTMAVYHHPVWTIGPSTDSGDPNRVRPIWELLANNGVDLVLTGHDHNYQRWTPMNAAGTATSTGTTQLVVGTGGHGIQSFVRSDSRVLAGFDSSPAAFGALRVELNAVGAAFQFADINGQTLDSGSVQCGSSNDTIPPSKPTGLLATTSNSPAVSLSWNASTDNVGVTGYDIFRDGQLLTSAGAGTSYRDTTTSGGTIYTYRVRARDAAGNVSPLSDPATVTTPALLFGDDFESGDLSNWTSVNGLVVQSAEVFAGSYAARGATTSSPTWAWRQLANTHTELFYRIRFKLVTDPGSTTYLGKFRTATGTSLLGIYVSSTGRLGLRNDAAASSTASSTAVTSRAWHEVQVRIRVNGAAGESQVWFDGAPVADLAKTFDLGTAAVGRIQLGDNAGGVYDVVFDDVQLNSTFIGDAPPTDSNPPTNPTGLSATAVSHSQVNLSWSASSDNVGVTGYDIYRNNSLLTTVGAQTTFTDLGVTPNTNYQYHVRARDGAGNVSGPSNPATVTTPPAPTSGTYTFAAVADSYVDSNRPTTNFGSSSALRIDAAPAQYSYLRFNLVGVAGTVSRVTLRIYAESKGNPGCDIYPVSDTSWTESGLNWSNAPARGARVAGCGPLSANTWSEIDLTAAGLVSGNGVISLAVGNPSTTAVKLSSREGAFAAELVVVTSGP